MSKSITLRQAAFVIVVLAVVQFILQMSLLTKGIEYAAVSLIIDDTYYYLQTAWNAKTLGFVTFDGLHATNGVQLLWFVIIFLLAILAKSKAILLFSTLAVSFFLNGLCYLVILKIGAILKQPPVAVFMSSLWALQSLPFRIYSMGMENSLHALIFWCVLWQSTVFLMRVQMREKPNFLGLTIVLILNAWTRLDSALLSIVLFSFCVGMLALTYRHDLELFLQRHFRSLVVSLCVASFGLIVQLTAFWLMGNSFLPVSALVKTGGMSQGSDIDSIDKLVRVVTVGMPSILQSRLPTLVLVLLGISGIVLLIVARVVTQDHSDEIRAFLNLWACLLVGEIIYDVYVALSGVEFTPYFVWHRSPSFIFWILSGALVILFALQRIDLVSQHPRGRRWVPVGIGLLIVSVAVYLFARSINFTSKLYAARYDAALWIAENSPPETVFAAWNAGQLGFFSDRTVINLDGLINNVDYYDRVLQGSIPLADYLLENKVDYIVDYSIYRPLPEYPIIHRFPLNDGSGKSIQIWQVSPQISLSS